MKTAKRKTLVSCTHTVVKRKKSSLPEDRSDSETEDVSTAVSTDPPEEETMPKVEEPLPATIDPKLISGVVSGGVLEGVYSCIRSLPPKPLAPVDEPSVLPVKSCKRMTLVLDLDETL
jgi:hypothetical protein